MPVTDVPLTVQKGIFKVFPSASLLDFSFVSGGCINHAGKLKTSAGDFFLKWNTSAQYPHMFIKEALGLNLLKKTNTLYIPEVVGCGEESNDQFLLLEFVNQQQQGITYWQDFGRQLAQLHLHRNERFGLSESNYIGSLVQHNTFKRSWSDFFIHERLLPQLDLGLGVAHISSTLRKKFDVLFLKLPALFPSELPSLVHGDLWSGNVITTSTGAPCLIDPAVYYGNREVDLAMTQLFGGFNNQYFDSYNEVNPLVPGYHKRFDLYNLYPLLVHVNLFGQAYVSQVNSIVTRYVS
jgi:protein-ribulosamine 3-kinase